MNTVKFELYRAFHSRSFVISLLIGSVICALDLITFCVMVGPGGRYLVQAWIGTDYLFAYNQMFYFLLPVLASLPYGGSLYTDVKNGYDKNICVKASRLNYAFAKSVSVFLSGFVSVCLPLVVNLFIAAGMYSNYVPERLNATSIALDDIYLFAAIFDKNPAIYCLVYILVDSLFAGAMALTSLSLTVKVKSSFTAVVTPMVLFFMFDIFVGVKDYGNWSILSMLNPRQYMHFYWYQMLIVYLVILIVNAAVITITSKKRDIL
ncbi:MAG: hypothetical protein K5779_05675 [Saccharofermentans sp.]|nr:hypothetical protein [Saccharofermentans sp.]